MRANLIAGLDIGSTKTCAVIGEVTGDPRRPGLTILGVGQARTGGLRGDMVTNIEEMTESHWAVVEFIRRYWSKEDLAPPVRLLCKESGVAVRHMYKLFTSGPARGACRIAGLPKPDGCV